MMWLRRFQLSSPDVPGRLHRPPGKMAAAAAVAADRLTSTRPYVAPPRLISHPHNVFSETSAMVSEFRWDRSNSVLMEGQCVRAK